MLQDSDKKAIQNAYTTYLNNCEIKPRMGQKQMIAHIARSMGGISVDSGTGERLSGGISIIEAGTGTGKTVAYLVATIPLAQRYEKKLILSTATIALQEQIINKDLPALLKHSGLKFSYELAKGRGRYMCPAQLYGQLESADPTQATLGLYPDEVDMRPTQDQRELLEAFRAAFKSHQWEGDRDSWPETIDDTDWRRVTTDHARCAGRKCEFISNCPFYKAREAIETADVIVANHDLVLADLALGGGAILSKPQETIYVFDEGHHLPDKALEHFASTCRLGASSKWLGSLEKQLPPVLTLASRIGVGAAAISELPSAVADTRKAQESIELTLAEEVEIPVDERGELPRFRFSQGDVGPVIRSGAEIVKANYQRLISWLDRFKSALEDGIEISSGADRAEAEAAVAGIAATMARAEDNYSLWQAWSHIDPEGVAPNARWISWMPDGDQLLCCSPVLASGTLRHQLWHKCFGAVITSATLSALGTFDRFKMRAGTHDDDTYAAVLSPFDFANVAQLRIPKAAVDPTDQRAFDQLLENDLAKLIDDKESTLVLFTARRHMEAFYDALPSSWMERVNYQGQYSRTKVIAEHRDRVDRGEPSILLGLASFAEGLDLPGDYCTRVVLVKLPFSVPDAPVEAQLAEWIEQRGGNPFMQITVPDASLRLVQSCGRLIRTEKDRGEIVLLDRRVLTRRYGQQLLNSLPPYKRVIE